MFRVYKRWSPTGHAAAATPTAHAESDLDLAVICAEAHLTPELKLARWRQCREALGLVGRGVDLVVQGQADAERLAGSRWHVMGDVAREGRVLRAAG
jgi:predicted nucleotidyltransferase